MRITKDVRGVPFANVERGGVVRFFADGKLCAGMKVYSAQGEKEGMLFFDLSPAISIGVHSFSS